MGCLKGGTVAGLVIPTPAYVRFATHYGVLEYRMANLTTSETAVVTTMLTNLNALELAVSGASANLDTDSAAVWKHNKNEVRDRVGLYRWARMELCKFFGVPAGEGLGSPGQMIV